MTTQTIELKKILRSQNIKGNFEFRNTTVLGHFQCSNSHILQELTILNKCESLLVTRYLSPNCIRQFLNDVNTYFSTISISGLFICESVEILLC